MTTMTMTEDKTIPKFVTTGEAAKALNAHPHTLRAWAKAGRIEHIVTAGGKFRFNVEGFIERERRGVRPASK